jgi:hypothetical protein
MKLIDLFLLLFYIPIVGCFGIFKALLAIAKLCDRRLMLTFDFLSNLALSQPPNEKSNAQRPEKANNANCQRHVVITSQTPETVQTKTMSSK